MRQPSAFCWALAQLHAQVSNSRLLPHAYAKYLPLVADSLDFFLRRLSPARLNRVFSEQLRLPPGTRTEERLLRLLQHSPVLHKLGQVVARDRQLSPQFRRRLQRLESLPPGPAAPVYTFLGRELRPWAQEHLEVSPTPLAEGSVAVVIPFKWSPHSVGGSRTARREATEGVFKLLKEGVEDVLEQDLEILTDFGRFLDNRCADFHLPALDYIDTFDTIRNLLTHEIDFEREQQNLVEAARAFACQSSVLIPALLPFCSSRLTAMERINGKKIVDFRREGSAAAEDLARIAIEALLVMPFFSTAPASLFHGDPHAGNLLATRGGDLALVDWSLTGRLTQADRASCLRLCLAAIALDLDGMQKAISGLCHSVKDRERLRQVLAEGLCRICHGCFPGVQWLTDTLDQCTLQAGAQLSGNLLVFRKVCWHLQGILSDLLAGSELRAQRLVDEVFSAGLIRSWICEWPQRLAAPFSSEELPTKLSNAELTSFLFSLSLAPARGWVQLTSELTEASR